MIRPGFKVLEHTADAGIVARGRTLDEAFEQTAVGMYSLMAASQCVFITFGAWLVDRYGFSAAQLSAVTFGLLTRNVHRWAAHLMVFFVFLHMMRVFYHGAYKPPREFNWVVGVVLLFLTLMLSFTGYLLPWDQIAYWAITIGSNMAGYAPLLNTPSKLLLLGGLEVGQNTLLRFYVLHVILMPLAAALFLAVHFWRIRKDGGISGPL